MIETGDLPGVPDDLANRVIAAAVAIAPCIDSLPKNVEGDPRRVRAIAILKGVAGHAASRSSANVKSQRVGSAAVDYGDASSWFSDDDTNALRALCTSTGALAGLPIGKFPEPGLIAGAWPERGT